MLTESDSEKYRSFDGEVSLGSRPMTAVELEAAEMLRRESTRQRKNARFGCAACLLTIIAAFPLGISVLPLPVTFLAIFGAIAIAVWLIPVLQSASFQAHAAQQELADGTVETFGPMEVQPVSGRIIASRGDQLAVPRYGIVRTLGRKPLVLDEFGGDRRLSFEERCEIERLIISTKTRVGIADLLATLWLGPLAMIVYVGTLEFNPLIPVLVFLAGIPTFLVYKRRWDARSVRQALGLALEADSLLEVDEDDHQIGLLMPKGLVWTIDGLPSPLRTRWQP